MGKHITSLADLTGDPKHAAITSGSISMGQPVTFGGQYFTGRVRPRRMPRWLWRIVRRRFPVRTLPIVSPVDANEPVTVGIAVSPTVLYVQPGIVDVDTARKLAGKGDDE